MEWQWIYYSNFESRIRPFFSSGLEGAYFSNKGHEINQNDSVQRSVITEYQVGVIASVGLRWHIISSMTLVCEYAVQASNWEQTIAFLHIPLIVDGDLPQVIEMKQQESAYETLPVRVGSGVCF